jgi:hypothetical protein
MAHYAKRPLNDGPSNDFLKSKGFHLLEDCSCKDSVWSFPSLRDRIYFPLSEIIQSDKDLYNALWKAGRRHGRQVADREIRREITLRMQWWIQSIVHGNNKSTEEEEPDKVTYA